MSEEPTHHLSGIFPGSSEMAARMRAFDWASTSLGDPMRWPDGLKVALRMLLTAKFEMWLGWGPDHLFFYNDAYIPTLGVKHPTALAAPFSRVWAEVYADVEDQVARVRAGESTWNDTLLLLLERSGSPEETYHSFSYSPLYHDGVVAGMLCIVSEQTNRVVAARRLDTLRQLGTALVGAKSEDVVRDAFATILSSNRKDIPFALIYLRDGLSEEMAFSSAKDAGYLIDRDWPVTASQLVNGPKRFDLDENLSYPCGDWDVPPCEAVAVSIPGPVDGSQFGYLVLGLNPYRKVDPDFDSFATLIAGQLSGAVSSLQALYGEKRRADRIWAHSRDLIVIVDAGGILQSVSPSWTWILGHPIEDVEGRHVSKFIMEADFDATRKAIATAISGTDLVGFENRLLTQTGEARWISWHSAMEDGFAYGYGRDITEQKKSAAALSAAEDALRQAQKMEAVGQLTGGIAHDFNNLLTGIGGSLERIKTRIAQGRIYDLEKFVIAAEGASKRAASLIHRLLAFSRQQTLAPKPVNANALIRGMIDLIQRSVGPSISVEFVAMGGLWATFVDAPQLENALLNLCINSRDAMPDGGKITIETGNRWIDGMGARAQGIPEGQYLSVCVSDTGAGMSQETIARAFDPFFTTKPIGQGTGLGLSMIYGFTKQSGGHVRIYSEPDKGTMVCLYLPRYRGEVPGEIEEQDQSIQARAVAGETVLIVDDEPTVRLLVTDVLTELGYTAIEASDSAGGLRVLQSEARIDLLISDVGLPGGMTGPQMVDAARDQRPHLRVLFITGFAENAILDSGLLEPGVAVMTKPFAVNDLAQQIRAMIEK